MMQKFSDILSVPNLLPYDGDARYIPDFLSPSVSADLMLELEKSVAWRQDSITLFGKKILQPRLTALYGEESYKYAGIEMQPTPWDERLRALKNQVESVTGASFNAVLLNFYRSGGDSMGWHRDNERELGREPSIASLSLGASRKFQLRHGKKGEQVSIVLESGSLLIMRGKTQHFWYHAVPKSSRIIESRINLTFRRIQNDL